MRSTHRTMCEGDKYIAMPVVGQILRRGLCVIVRRLGYAG